MPAPLVRLLLRIAYRLARCWWFLTRPAHRGALVAAWHAGRLLLVRTSYRPGWGLPGGGVRRGEAPLAAALREAEEELGLRLCGSDLRLALAREDLWEHRRDHVHLFEVFLAAAPTLQPDGREIVEAEFVTPEAAAARRLPPHVRLYLERLARETRAS